MEGFMKQLVILSGKGGTGKTTIAASFVFLANEKFRSIEKKSNVCFADCDVDVPNLHLIFTESKKLLSQTYYGLRKAVIDQSICIHCGVCEENCRFDAVKNGVVNTYLCDGCGVCNYVCPVSNNGNKAVKLEKSPAGEYSIYNTKLGVLSTASLKIGGGTTGKLVNGVKRNLEANTTDEVLAIVDGSPGIGCPVVASVAESDMVLLVAEPSISGISDLKKVVASIEILGIPMVVCINKSDLCLEKKQELIDYCQKSGLPIIGEIPTDQTVTKAINHARTVVEYSDSPAAIAISDIFEKTIKLLDI